MRQVQIMKTMCQSFRIGITNPIMDKLKHSILHIIEMCVYWNLSKRISKSTVHLPRINFSPLESTLVS